MLNFLSSLVSAFPLSLSLPPFLPLSLPPIFDPEIDTTIDIIPSIRCISQYWFESGNEHVVSVKPHGNSKAKNESYCRTHSSTLAALKCEAEAKCPKEAVNTVYEPHGGIMESNSLESCHKIESKFLI